MSTTSSNRSNPNVKLAMERRNVVAPPAAVDHMLRGFYPLTWDEFIGQDMAKTQLRVAARAAKARGVPLPHTLIADGAQGIGKTSLALLAAKEMDVAVRVASGKIGAAQARLLLSGMTDGDVLIIDEAHQMVQSSKRDAEWLLHYLQDGVLVGPLGPEEVPRVTIILCTTDAGRLQETVLDRCKLRPALHRYTDTQATKIALVQADRIFSALKMPTLTNCRVIASAANNNPRIIGNLLESLRDIETVAHEDGRSTYKGRKGYDLTETLAWHGLTEDGLNLVAQRYLIALVEDFNGEPAGSAALQDRLQQPGGLTAVERVLVDKGYIKRIKQGRTVTQAGIKRARELGALG